MIASRLALGFVDKLYVWRAAATKLSSKEFTGLPKPSDPAPHTDLRK